MRSQFESKEGRAPLSTGFDLGGWSMASYSRYTETTTDGKTSSGRMQLGDVESQSPGRRSGASETTGDSELESDVLVQVQIEETVTVEFDPEAFVRESYRTPRVLWGQDAARDSGQSTGDSRREQGVERDASQSRLSNGGASRR